MIMIMLNEVDEEAGYAQPSKKKKKKKKKAVALLTENLEQIPQIQPYE
jgi:hypothetical protein